MHHLDCTTGQTKTHGPHRTAARPANDLFQCGGDKTLSSFLISCCHYSHSNAPFFHSKIKPMTSKPRNTSIDTKPKIPRWRNATAQGKKNAVSKSKRINRIATK